MDLNFTSQAASRQRASMKSRLRNHALELYRDRNNKSIEIATRLGISPATITVWAKSAGLPLRKQGRRRESEPSQKSRGIVELALEQGQSTAAAHFGISRSRVCALMKRWRGWVEKKPAKDRDTVF